MGNTKAEVVIIGGGMVGLPLAIALSEAGIDTVLVDREKPETQTMPKFDGRVSAIAWSSARMLRTLGIWQFMEQEAEPILDIRVSDNDSLAFLHYDHTEVGEHPFGYIVENRHIRRALHLRAAECGKLRWIWGTAMTRLELQGPHREVKLENGECIEALLAVGADGKFSRMREALDIDCLQWEYDQSAIVCTIAHTQPHHGLAQERFLPKGPFAVLPMTPLRQGFGGQAGNRSSLVWVEPKEAAPHYLKLPEAELAKEITWRIGNYLGEITLQGPRFCYPLSLSHAQSYVAERAALIGDAAHAIHPLAGQGVNLGFRDVAVLAELLADAKRTGLDIGSMQALEHYQRWRRLDNVAMMVATDTLNRLFSTPLAPVRLARRLGLQAVGKMPSLKRFFMRHAMGMTGKLPQLLRGESLEA